MLLPVLLSGLLGCAHLVDVTSVPPGVEVRYAGQPVGTAPVTLRVRHVGPRRVEATLVGYRPVQVTLPLSLTTTRFVGDVLLVRPLQGLGVRFVTTLELRLVKEHGAVGTWSDVELP